jgi:hypothetical protein
MSEENIEIVRRLAEAVQLGVEHDDPGAILDTGLLPDDAECLLADDAEWILPVPPATGKASGVPVEWHGGMVIELRDGRAIRTTNYVEPAEALEAAGLSE